MGGGSHVTVALCVATTLWSAHDMPWACDRRMLSRQRFSVMTEEFCFNRDSLSQQTGPVARKFFFFDPRELGRHKKSNNEGFK